MTISTTTYKNTYTGDGADTTFNFSFPVLTEDHILVQVVNSSNVVQDQTLDVDYTVSGTGNADGATDYQTGTVTFTSPPSNGLTVIIKRNVPLTQTYDYIENDRFPAETHEEALDKLTHIVQQQQEQIDRSFKIDYSGSDEVDFSLPAGTANYYLRFNDDASGLEAVANTGTIGIDSVQDDPSPVLSGSLDVNNNIITSNASGDITLDPNGTGNILLNAASVRLEAKLEHAGNTTTYIEFTTNTQDFQVSGSSKLNINGSGLQLGGANARVTTVLNENTLTSDSATSLVTQSSVKSYIDTTTVNSGNSKLQADLDVDGFDITTTASNKDIDINPHGSGSINLTADTGGLINLTGSVYITDTITHIGDTDTRIDVTSDNWSFLTNSLSRLNLSNDGLTIGFGTGYTLITVSGKTYTESAFDTSPSSNLWDSNTGTYWRDLSYTASDWAKIDFGSGNTETVTQYELYPGFDIYRWTGWTLEGSNDDSAWTTVDSRSSETMNAVAFNSFRCNGVTGAYRYYRFTNIVSVSGSEQRLSDVRFYEGALESATVDVILDEDTLITDSDTALATQQSIKAYVDTLESEWLAHSSTPKFWVKFSDAGTAAIDDSYNVTSVSDDGTGEYTITIDTDFADADWCVVGMATGTSSVPTSIYVTAQAAGSVTVEIRRIDVDVAVDPTSVYIAGFGTQ